MTQEKPSEEDLEKIITEIESNLKEIKKTLEIDPETIKEMVHKSHELTALSIRDMTLPLMGRANYQCNAEEDCETCLVKTCHLPRMLEFPTPMFGKIHYPPIRMPQPNLIRKAGNEIDSEIMKRIWRNLKWK